LKLVDFLERLDPDLMGDVAALVALSVMGDVVAYVNFL
jgi:hypothetical protein